MSLAHECHHTHHCWIAIEQIIATPHQEATFEKQQPLTMETARVTAQKKAPSLKVV